MTGFLIGLHIVVCVLLIILVLLQSGKGAEIGASLGAGSSQTLFGSSGGATFFTRSTAVLATLFMLTSISLTYLKARETGTSVFDRGGLPVPTESAPAPGTPDLPGTATEPTEAVPMPAPIEE